MPHPCLALVVDVLHNEYGLIAGDLDTGSYIGPLRQRAELALELLQQRCVEVSPSNRKAGDIVLFDVAGYPAHVGILINANDVMHVPHEDNRPCIERLVSPYIKARVLGYYRCKI